MAGKSWDAWQVNEIIAHDLRRTVTETDNLLTCALTRNYCMSEVTAGQVVEAAEAVLRP